MHAKLNYETLYFRFLCKKDSKRPNEIYVDVYESIKILIINPIIAQQWQRLPGAVGTLDPPGYCDGKKALQSNCQGVKLASYAFQEVNDTLTDREQNVTLMIKMSILLLTGAKFCAPCKWECLQL